MKLSHTVAVLSLFAAPAFADGHETGDAEKGKKAFNKCKSCHMIQDAEGNTILKGGKTGPNLYGVIGRQIGSADFKYGKSLVEVGETGAVWEFDNFMAYIADPKGWLKEALDDTSAKSKMSFRLKKGGEDIYAYLVSVGPELEASDEETSSD
ncbi:MAG: cytochrome c family protein [Paracoccaceae bacterium]